MNGPQKRLMQIEADGPRPFTAGLEFGGVTVAAAAPIIKYMLGWNLIKVLAYCKGKGWRCREIKED